MSKTPKNKIVVLVIEDEALILDLMEEVLADLDVPRKKYGVVDLGTFIGPPLSISEALFQLSNVMPYAAEAVHFAGGRHGFVRGRLRQPARACSSIIRLTCACSRAYTNYCGEKPNAAIEGNSRCAAPLATLQIFDGRS